MTHAHFTGSPIHFICPLLFIGVEILRIVLQNTATNHQHPASLSHPETSHQPSCHFPAHHQRHLLLLLLLLCLFPLAPIRSIVPHDPATDCLRSILDTLSVFEVATSTLSACSSRKLGRRNSSSSAQSEFSTRSGKRRCSL